MMTDVILLTLYALIAGFLYGAVMEKDQTLRYTIIAVCACILWPITTVIVLGFKAQQWCNKK